MRSVLLAVLFGVSVLVLSGCGGGRPCVDRGIYTVNADGSDERRVIPSKPSTYLADVRWVAGGKRLAFTDEYNQWWWMNADGSDVRQWTERPDRFDYAISPDRRWYAHEATPTFSGSKSIYRESTRTGATRRLTLSQRKVPVRWEDRVDDVAPAWSPKRNEIAFVRRRRGGGDAALYLMNADGSQQRAIAPKALGFAWSPDGTRLVVVGYSAKEPVRLFNE